MTHVKRPRIRQNSESVPRIAKQWNPLDLIVPIIHKFFIKERQICFAHDDEPASQFNASKLRLLERIVPAMQWNCMVRRRELIPISWHIHLQPISRIQWNKNIGIFLAKRSTPSKTKTPYQLILIHSQVLIHSTQLTIHILILLRLNAGDPGLAGNWFERNVE